MPVRRGVSSGQYRFAPAGLPDCACDGSGSAMAMTQAPAAPNNSHRVADCMVFSRLGLQSCTSIPFASVRVKLAYAAVRDFERAGTQGVCRTAGRVLNRRTWARPRHPASSTALCRGNWSNGAGPPETPAQKSAKPVSQQPLQERFLPVHPNQSHGGSHSQAEGVCGIRHSA